MKTTFIVPGYGVPKKSADDVNLQLYLRAVFNRICDALSAGRVRSGLIVLTGGRTDLFKPYRRTEAGEMAALFRPLMEREIVRPVMRGTRLVVEKSALSSVENLLAAKKQMVRHGMAGGRIVLFCEHTRVPRMRRVGRTVFGARARIEVIGVDFDISANRYRDPKFLAKKEAQALHLDLWALRSPANLRRYRAIHEERLRYLRQAGGSAKAHVEAVNRWWQLQLEELPRP